MAASRPFAKLHLDVAGLGIILYSPFAVAHIAEGDDYLQAQFWEPEAVAKHVMACGLTCFCTGSPGRYRLSFIQACPPDDVVNRATLKLRLGIEVRDSTVCVRDLYDLMDWSAECPEGQQVKLADGFYRITVLSATPRSGITGDNQRITLYFDQVKKKPQLRYEGVPSLLPDGT
jgi:hypothetical protein